MRRAVKLPPRPGRAADVPQDAASGARGPEGGSEPLPGPGSLSGPQPLHAVGPPSGPHRPPDATLIEQSWSDPEQFAALFDRHADEMHRYAVRRLGLDDAADVVSEVFLIAFRKRAGYDVSRPDARPWLYGISARVISQHLRADGRRARALAATPAPRPAELPVDDITDRITAAQLRPRLLSVLD